MIGHFRRGEDLTAWYTCEVRDQMLALGKFHVIISEDEEPQVN